MEYKNFRFKEELRKPKATHTGNLKPHLGTKFKEKLKRFTFDITHLIITKAL